MSTFLYNFFMIAVEDGSERFFLEFERQGDQETEPLFQEKVAQKVLSFSLRQVAGSKHARALNNR